MCSVVYVGAPMSEKRPNRFNVLLDDEHAAKLYTLAERTYLQPGALARSLLCAVLDQAEAGEGIAFTAVLDAIPGAWKRAAEGMADAKSGRSVLLDEL
jgi:predicted transcriptional regulator